MRLARWDLTGSLDLFRYPPLRARYRVARLQFRALRCHRFRVTGTVAGGDDLVTYLCRSSGLHPGEAERLVGEVLAYFSETLEEFVRRRHRELQARGFKNEEIFDVIAREIPQRRVMPRVLSRRQIRRVIYG